MDVTLSEVTPEKFQIATLFIIVKGADLKNSLIVTGIAVRIVHQNLAMFAKLLGADFATFGISATRPHCSAVEVTKLASYYCSSVEGRRMWLH